MEGAFCAKEVSGNFELPELTRYGNWKIADLGINGLQLPEGGDFEALHCQPSTNFHRSRKLDLTIEPPLLGRCCYAMFYSLNIT
jgi:hypothetical protein